jgi:hypothetical protein
MYHHGWDEENFFINWIRETKETARIYIIVGESDTHLGLLDAMFEEDLFNENLDEEYFVIGIRADVWDPDGKFDTSLTLL